MLITPIGLFAAMTALLYISRAWEEASLHPRCIFYMISSQVTIRPARCYGIMYFKYQYNGREKHKMPDNGENETDQDELDDKRPLVTCITVGIFQENCYLYACPVTHEAVIIDPGDEAPRILSRIEELGFIPKYILNTHGHIDHICAIDEVRAVYAVPFAIHADDVYMLSDERTAQMYGRKAPLVKREPDMLLKEGNR